MALHKGHHSLALGFPFQLNFLCCGGSIFLTMRNKTKEPPSIFPAETDRTESVGLPVAECHDNELK